jgi:acyl carrier protein
VKVKICEILSSIFETTVQEHDSVDTIETWDSLSHLQAVMAIEDEFCVKFDTQEIYKLDSVAAFIRVLKEVRSENN